MVEFVYRHSNYEEFLEDFARNVGISVHANRIDFPPGIAAGYMECFQPAEGLSAVVIDATLHRDFHFEREKSESEFYILRFEKVTTPDTLQVRMGEQESPHASQARYSFYLTSSETPFQYIARKGLQIQAVFISIHKEWLYGNIREEALSGLLGRYFELETASVNLEVFAPEYFDHCKNIFNGDPEDPLRRKKISLRILLLIETFFIRLTNKVSELDKITSEELTRQELSRVIELAARLLRDLSTPPPTAEELAKTVGMSVSKLKQVFKQVFHSGIYAYYQQNRMNMARLMLNSGTYSVKETGMKLGYENLSQFAAAFRKQFNYLPSEYAQS